MEDSKQPAVAALQTQAPIYAALLVGGIIVGVLLATAWSTVNPKAAPEVASVATSTAAPASTSGAPTTAKSSTQAPVVVEDQEAGGSVSIKSLNIARPTWVVVYVSREGKPGNALGARLYFAGDKKGTVSLLRATEPGQRYFVGLSVDNGDRVFSLSKDLPVADADGGRLWATFSAR
ncbi:MAG TPA: hypothetical protein VJJ20_01360 [Candidatus Paceibacterota bacterium]